MEENNREVKLSESQSELLKFINTVDAKDLAISFKNVFNMALFNSEDDITNKQKDDLYMLDKLITLTNKLANDKS
jgi:hypothetical protein